MLTDKQELFLTYYLRYQCSVSKAARAMGLSPKAGLEIAKNRLVIHEARKRVKALGEQTACTPERVLAELSRIAFHDPLKVFEHRRERCSMCWAGWKGPGVAPVEPDLECQGCRGEGHGSVFVRDTRDLGPNERASVASIVQKKDGVEVKLQGKTKALELIARHLGMFVERVQLSTPEGTGVLLVPGAMTLDQWKAKAAAAAQ